MRGLGGLALRSGTLLLLIPPVLISLRLLLVGSRLPGVQRLWWAEEQDGAVVVSVISIEPERSPYRRGAHFHRPGVTEDVVVHDVARAYEDENEVHERQVRTSAEFKSTNYSCRKSPLTTKHHANEPILCHFAFINNY